MSTSSSLGEILRVLLRHAPYVNKAGISLDALRREEVGCQAERYVYDAAGKQLGRVDLVFQHSDLKLLLEVKIWSDYRDNQLSDYLQAAGLEPNTFVASLTRNVSIYRDPDPSEPRWLGSLRWARIAQDLRDVADAPILRSDWDALMTVLEDDGDLGDVKLTAPLVEAWANYERAADRLWTFLEEIAYDALDVIGDHVKARAPRLRRDPAAFVPLRKSKSSRAESAKKSRGGIPIKFDADALVLRFAIPAGGPQRFSLGFDAPDNVGRFFMEAGLADPEALTPTQRARWRGCHERLAQSYAGRSEADLGEWDEFAADVILPLAGFVGLDDVPNALSAALREHLPIFAASGILDADLLG